MELKKFGLHRGQSDSTVFLSAAVGWMFSSLTAAYLQQLIIYEAVTHKHTHCQVSFDKNHN